MLGAAKQVVADTMSLKAWIDAEQPNFAAPSRSPLDQRRPHNLFVQHRQGKDAVCVLDQTSKKFAAYTLSTWELSLVRPARGRFLAAVSPLDQSAGSVQF